MAVIPPMFKNPANNDDILIIYTPAIPVDLVQLKFFKSNGYKVFKRSQVLGEISRKFKTIAIGGSHGKTTISAMITEIFRKSNQRCSAFIGGISKTIESNLLYTPESDWAIIEADEFDRSFLFLHPDIALVSSMDPDHLDVYGDKDQLSESFRSFLNLLDENGIAIIKEGLELIVPTSKKLKVKYYGLDAAKDYFASNIRQVGLNYHFDLNTPGGLIKDIKTAIPGWINIENAVGASAVCLEAGLSEKWVREGISSFQGIRRRFDVRIFSSKMVYIDDYAHHPKEIRSFLRSIKKLFPTKKITGIFQPHLFSRTRDFALEFGRELSILDELILLDIYPAREQAMEGVTSQLILDAVEIKDKCLQTKEELISRLDGENLEVIVTMGAGDIDQLVNPIEEYLNKYAS